MNLISLVFLWAGWCVLHSLLVDTSVNRLLKARLGRFQRILRLLYNMLALATFMPLAAYTASLGGEAVFAWRGWFGGALRFLVLAMAFFLFWGGAKRYDLRSFLGLRQLRDGQATLLLNSRPDFSPEGVFGITRHPWYLGTFLALWAILPEYPPGAMAAVGVLSLYLVVGSLLEERKILREYGADYRAYQQQVSMLFPWKWLKKGLRR